MAGHHSKVTAGCSVRSNYSDRFRPVRLFRGGARLRALELEASDRGKGHFVVPSDGKWIVALEPSRFRDQLAVCVLWNKSLEVAFVP